MRKTTKTQTTKPEADICLYGTSNTGATSHWLHVWVFDQAALPRPGWRRLDNGPFPISREQLDEARRRYREEWERTAPLSGVRVTPQTTARAILHDVAPKLSNFDAMMLGFAVSNDRVRTSEYDEESER